MYFETHAHYDDKAFDADRDTLIPELNACGVHCIINPGCDQTSSRTALELAEKYGFVFAAVGIHPEEVHTIEGDYISELTGMALHPKCVAIGEIGLDYYWKSDNKEEQKQVFIRQLELASMLGKPVIIHDREAHGDCLEIVKAFPNLRGVFHCYSGSPEMAEILLKMGWYLGFDGPVTYKNAKKTVEVLKMCPIDRILIETDSPYMSPVPVRGTRNTSENLKYICAKIAEIKELDVQTVAAVTGVNAEKLFF